VLLTLAELEVIGMSDLRILPNIIIVPKREVVKVGNNRWIIYLPQEYNEVWEAIKRSGKKVRVYIEVIENE